MSRTKLYVAGPMRGHEEYNFPAFDKAAYALRKVGYAVVSPAELDRVNGVDEFSDVDENLAQFKRDVMQRDCKAICGCDGIALLDDWDKSEGVEVEIALARFLGLNIQGVEKWLE